VARGITRTSRQTCGACHFYGGGGDGVKHGDLDSSLAAADRALDVHMDVQRTNYACATCHTARGHDIAGRKYTESAPNSHRLALPHDDGLRIGCENCHGEKPHNEYAKLNDHTDTVACQTCHIPAIARGGVATQTRWDWSTAGSFKPDGSKKIVKDSAGNVVYHSMKGDMSWACNIVPEYFWYDGTMHYADRRVALSADAPVRLNAPRSSFAAGNARIHPFKPHLGVQPYDARLKVLVVPKLFGPKGSGAFWSGFDWQRAAYAGMAEAGLPFSGEVRFVETVMYSPVNHMVAPKEAALSCDACHSRAGRLAHVAGFYLPGRDFSGLLDGLGWTLVLVSLCSVLAHAALRAAAKQMRRRKK